jgi:hypothetical protein
LIIKTSPEPLCGSEINFRNFGYGLLAQSTLSKALQPILDCFWNCFKTTIKKSSRFLNKS